MKVTLIMGNVPLKFSKSRVSANPSPSRSKANGSSMSRLYAPREVEIRWKWLKG